MSSFWSLKDLRKIISPSKPEPKVRIKDGELANIIRKMLFEKLANNKQFIYLTGNDETVGIASDLTLKNLGADEKDVVAISHSLNHKLDLSLGYYLNIDISVRGVINICREKLANENRLDNGSIRAQ